MLYFPLADENNLIYSELQAQNDDTLYKLYDNQDRIDASREWLLEDKAGIAPRMYHFDMNSVSFFFIDSRRISLMDVFYSLATSPS